MIRIASLAAAVLAASLWLAAPVAAEHHGHNPCNPCAAKANPCNPCAAKANPCNPCAAKANPCNPCNPCAAKANPCNPCAAKKNPCAGKNPCGMLSLSGARAERAPERAPPPPARSGVAAPRDRLPWLRKRGASHAPPLPSPRPRPQGRRPRPVWMPANPRSRAPPTAGAARILRAPGSSFRLREGVPPGGGTWLWIRKSPDRGAGAKAARARINKVEAPV